LSCAAGSSRTFLSSEAYSSFSCSICLVSWFSFSDGSSRTFLSSEAYSSFSCSICLVSWFSFSDGSSRTFLSSEAYSSFSCSICLVSWFSFSDGSSRTLYYCFSFLLSLSLLTYTTPDSIPSYSLFLLSSSISPLTINFFGGLFFSIWLLIVSFIFI
jgi:hypothetical protein